MRPKAATSSPTRHFETIEPHLRHRLLLRMSQQFDSGVRDPELLYLGARYAASLGMEQQAARFLEPLSALLRSGEELPPAWFPVGLLWLSVLAPGEKRDAVGKDLAALAAASPVLATALRAAGAGASRPAGIPSEILDALLQDTTAIANLFAPAKGKTALAAQTLAANATQAYQAGDLSGARMALEELLLTNSDQPDVLRNLLVVAGEQQDIAAYQRYWRRYVKLNLSRLMIEDQAWAAHEELVRFYTLVATITDRAFSTGSAKQTDQLRQRGLLSSWVEAQAALVWLQSAAQPDRDRQTRLGERGSNAGQLGQLSVMKFWFRAFYPEFTSYLDLGTRPRLAASADPARISAKPEFDPARKLLTRFAEWSREGFGIPSDKDVSKDQEADNEAHKEAVEVLGGCAARIPWQPYVKDLQETLRGKDTQVRPFRETMQEACTNAHAARFVRLRDADNPAALVAAFDDPDLLPALSPHLRMEVAMAACKIEKPRRALEIAFQMLDDLKDDDIRDKKDDEEHAPIMRLMWQHVLDRNVEAVFKLPEHQRPGALDGLRASLPKASRAARLQPFLRACDAMIAFKEAFERVKKHLEKKELRAARQVVDDIPETSNEVKGEKAKLLDFIADHEEDAKISAMIEQAKVLIQKFRYGEARMLVQNTLKRQTFAELKGNLLKQIDESEEEHRTVVRENGQLRQRLGYRYNDRDISKLVKLNKLDESNPFHMNQLLKFLQNN